MNNEQLSPTRREKPLVSDIRINTCLPELKELIGQMADAAQMPLGEYVVKVLADHAGRPDLATIPRKHPGRPRKPMAVPR